MNKFYTYVKSLVLSLLIIGSVAVQAQTVLISPTGDGGFENGSTFAANGWTVVNSGQSFFVGTATPNPPGSTNGNNFAYTSTTSGTWTPGAIASVAHFYKDIAIPAGEPILNISLRYIISATDPGWDFLKVHLVPTTVLPVAGTQLATGQLGVNTDGTTSYATYNFSTNANAFAGGTARLVISFRADGVTPHGAAGLDEISVISNPPGNFISIASGNWSNPATWDANAVPTANDNVTISTGHLVTIDAANQTALNLTVNGTLNYAVTPTAFQVVGNLTVNTGGLFNVFNATTGKTLNVGGNIINNGRIDLSVSNSTTTTTQGNLTLNGSTVQTVSGTGVFGGTVIATNNTNTEGVIRHLVFSNTNTSTPNVIWNVNNVRLMNGINTTGARIDLNGNKIYQGNFDNAAGTITLPVGTGFFNGSYSRWWTTSQTGTGITAGTDPTNATSRYPFINSIGQNRAFYISRSSSSTTGNTAGYLTVTFNDVAGVTTGLNITDGAYTITDRVNGNWLVTTENGYDYVSGTHTLVGFYQGGLFVNNNTAARLMNPNGVVGTFQTGSITPAAQRIGISTSQLVAEPFHIGSNTNDILHVSIASGNWDNPAIWNKGTVPTCTSPVTIESGHNVTVNSAANVSSNLTINTGGTLTVSSGELTVGCTNNNTPLTNNGILTVTGGILNVNGNMVHNSGATFNQSGGDINIDGNNGGVAATSVASGVSIVQINTQNINWTGGRLTIVDPHANATASNSFAYNTGVGLNANIPNTHIIRFGNGVSTDAGGNAINGFRINTWVGSGRISLGTFVIQANGGTNRQVTTTWEFGINGNLIIFPNSTLQAATVNVAGDIINNGTYISTTLLRLASFLNGTVSASPNPQSISGTGVFQNLAASPTANLTSFTINNSSISGVTLNSPISVSGTLTLTSGVVTTSNTNILSLGTATAAGTLTGGSATAYINGPFARTIANANANTNYIAFPVGKTTYNPVFLAPNTTSVSVFTAESFDSNTGTADASIDSLANNRRWEALLVSGTFNNINVRVGDANLTNTRILAQAPSAAGIYTGAFGSTATFAAGTPNTIQSNNALLAANYTGFLSYSVSNICSGTPTAGNIVGTSTVCSGSGTTLTLSGATNSSGITIQWKVASVSGGPYTNLGTNLTQATGPLTADAYYVATVTCGPSGDSATTAEFVVNINALPTVTVTPATSNYCTGAPAVALSAGGANTYIWSPAVGLSATTGATVNANPSATTTYTVTGTDANNCTNTATATVNVFTTPIITSTTATPSNICNGANSQLQATAITYAPIKITEVTVFRTGTGSTSPYPAYATGADLVEISNISSVPFDISGFILRAFGNNNGTSSHTVTFPAGTIIPANSVAVIHLGTGTNDLINRYFNTGGTNDFYSSGSQVGIVLYNGTTVVDAVGLGGSAAGSYTFNAATGVTALDWTGFAPNASGLAGVRRTAAIDNNIGADWTASGAANIQTIGTYDNIYNAPAPSPVSFTWSPSTFLNDSTIANPEAQGVTSTTTYTVIANNNGCPSAPATVPVNVDQLSLTLSVTPNDTVCQGSNITLQSNPLGGGQPYTYSWTGPNNFTSSIQNPAITNAQPNASGFYVLELTDNCGTTLIDSIEITVHANPIVTVTPDTAQYCNPGTPVALTASGADTYSWSPVAGLSATTGTSVNASPTANTNYIVIGTDLNGCIGRDTAVINVVLSPVIASVTATPSTICQGDTTQLDVAMAANSSYCIPSIGFTGDSGDYIESVEFANLSNLLSGDNPADYQYFNNLTANVIADGTTPYILTLTPGTAWSQQFRVWIDFNQNGIFEANESIFSTTTATTTPVSSSVTIPNSAFNGITRMRVACRFSTVILDTEACGHAGFGEYEDYNVLITGGTPNTLTYIWTPSSSLNNASINNPMAYPNATEAYTVTVTDNNGCPATQTVTVNVNPAPIVDLGADTLICGGTDLLLDAGNAGADYVWNDNSTNQTLLAIASGVYTVTVTELVNNCSTTDSISVVLGVIPSVTLPADTAICSGSNLTINAGSGFATYDWSTGDNTQSITVSTANTYSVTVTNNDGCEASDNIVVSVNPLPIVSLGNDTTICNNQNLVLNAGAGFASYSWTPSGNTQTITATGANTVNTYTVTVTDNNGCSNTDAIIVTFSTCAGDKEEEMNNYISLYPNPNNGTFFVDVISQSNSVEFNLVDLTGKVIYSEIVNSGNITRKQLDLQAQPAGIYLLVIKSDNMSKTLRISKY